MTLQVTGVLELPLQNPSAKTEIRFICTTGVANVLKTATQVFTCGIDGSYDFPLLNGMYVVEVKYQAQWNFLGHINVTDAIGSPIDMKTLLSSAAVPIPVNVAELPSYNVLNPRGDWDASPGFYPPDPMYPTKLSDTWRISVAGTMDNGSYTMAVKEDDVIYWSLVNQRWQRIGNSFGLEDVPLQEGETIVGNQFGQAEAISVASMITQQISVHTFDGTAATVDIVHNKNRKVYPLYFDERSVIEYPVYAEIDSNTLRVASAAPLTGTLIIL